MSAKAQFSALYSLSCMQPHSVLSSMSLNHHLYADDMQFFLSFHPSEFHSNITHLQNTLPGWLQIFSTLLKLNFFLSDLNNNFLKCMTPLSPQPTLLTTLALFLMNALSSQTKYLHFLNPANITFVNFAVSVHISTSKQPAPLPPPLSILNLITVTLPITAFQTINLTGYNRFKTILLMLLQRLFNSLATHSSSVFCSQPFLPSPRGSRYEQPRMRLKFGQHCFLYAAPGTLYRHHCNNSLTPTHLNGNWKLFFFWTSLFLV